MAGWMRWLLAGIGSVASFAVVWWLLQGLAGMGRSDAIAAAVVPFTAVLTASAWWAQKSRTDDSRQSEVDASRRVYAPEESSTTAVNVEVTGGGAAQSGQVVDEVSGGVNIGPGAVLQSPVFNLGGQHWPGPSDRLGDRAVPVSAGTDSSADPAGTPLLGPPVTDRWRVLSGREDVTQLTRLDSIILNHPGLPAEDHKMPPSVRYVMVVPCGELGPELSTSAVRKLLLAFLSRDPVRRFVASMSDMTGASWSTWDGEGRFNFSAVLSNGDGEALAAWARLLLPVAGQAESWRTPLTAALVLRVFPRMAAGSPALPTVLPDWKDRIAIGLDTPAALGRFLVDDLHMIEHAQPPVQAGISLQAQPSLTALVDISGLRIPPGSTVSSWYRAWAVADPAGQGAPALADLWVREMCDCSLHVDEYEHLLAPPDPATQITE